MTAPRLPHPTGREAIQALERAGFVVTHVRGSHFHLRHPTTGRATTVVVHGARSIAPGTLLSILRQTGVSREEFVRLLRD